MRYREDLESIRLDAIKEFAEKLKEEIVNCETAILLEKVFEKEKSYRIEQSFYLDGQRVACRKIINIIDQVLKEQEK